MQLLRIKYAQMAVLLAGARNLTLGRPMVKSFDPFPIFELRISSLERHGQT
jgi:hypothetical protein